MKCLYPITLQSGKGFACRKCMPCRINHQQLWASKIKLELMCWPASVCYFVTLTYDNEHLPLTVEGTETLSKLDVHKWREALRYRQGFKVRHFTAGEYGEKSGRAHYHAVLFGYTSDPRHIQKCWPHGFAHIQHVIGAHAAYAAGYVTKKITGDQESSHYGSRLPEFSQMSRIPALGDHQVVRYGHWLLTPAGQAYIKANTDVPASFRTEGKTWLFSPRHRKMMRLAAGLPPLQADVYRDAGVMPPAPDLTLTTEEREVIYEKKAARSRIFQSRTSRV